MTSPTTGRPAILPEAVKRLLADSDFQALVGPVVGTDATYGGGWVFQGLTPQGGSVRAVEGTGKASVTLQDRDDWLVPVTSAQYPLLRVFIWVDCTRDSMGAITARDADAKCRQIWEVVRKVFHDPIGEVENWGEIYLSSTLVHDNLSIMDVPNGDGSVRGTGSFEIAMAE